MPFQATMNLLGIKHSKAHSTKRFIIPICFILYSVLSSVFSLTNHAVIVNLTAPAILTCEGTCTGNFSWKFKREELEVFKCNHITCTDGNGFKNRASLPHENLSLILNPTLYNDEGWYEASCGSKLLCRVHLEIVAAPTSVDTLVGHNVTLPCYALTEKQISDNDVNILWKNKDEEVVLQVKNGIPSCGPDFQGRASVSVNRYRDGDLSLTILRVTSSDSGLYLCHHKIEEDHGYPRGVKLIVKASDSGIFTVKDMTDGISSVNNATVEASTNGTLRHHIIVPVLFGCFILCILCLFIWCQYCRKSTAQPPQCYFDTTQSAVKFDTAFLREPASVPLSQQETMMTDDVPAHAPVEETMPDTGKTTEKQDTTEEELSAQPLFENELEE